MQSVSTDVSVFAAGLEVDTTTTTGVLTLRFGHNARVFLTPYNVTSREQAEEIAEGLEQAAGYLRDRFAEAEVEASPLEMWPYRVVLKPSADATKLVTFVKARHSFEAENVALDMWAKEGVILTNGTVTATPMSPLVGSLKGMGTT